MGEERELIPDEQASGSGKIVISRLFDLAVLLVERWIIPLIIKED